MCECVFTFFLTNEHRYCSTFSPKNACTCKGVFCLFRYGSLLLERKRLDTIPKLQMFLFSNVVFANPVAKSLFSCNRFHTWFALCLNIYDCCVTTMWVYFLIVWVCVFCVLCNETAFIRFNHIRYFKHLKIMIGFNGFCGTFRTRCSLY